MADTLTATFDPAFTAVFKRALSVSTIPDRLVAGSPSFAALTKTLANGTGANKANKRYWHNRTVANGTNDDIDLTTLTDDFGSTINFSLLKWVLIRLSAPATGVRVVIGNAGTNSFVGWFGAAAHTEEVRDQLWRVNQIDGWTVDNTHKILRINNPTGSPIAYDIALLGQ